MKKLSLMSFLLVCTLTGCGEPPSIPPPKPPHSGSLFTEIGGNKIVEIVRQNESAGAGKTQFTAYFLDDKMKPLAPPPTAASFKPKSPRDAPAVELKPIEPVSDAGMTCPPIEDSGELGGQLTATIDGKPVVFSINVR